MSCAKSDAPPTEPATSSSDTSTALECDLRVEPRIALGQPVVVHFRLRQRGAQPLYVLDWRTPLEGLFGDDFKITHNLGPDIPYVGPMFKRGDPLAKNYRRLDPATPLEADVEVSLAYDFTKAGRYRIVFRGPVRDVVSQPNDVPRPLDRHQPVPVQCGPVDTEIVP